MNVVLSKFTSEQHLAKFKKHFSNPGFFHLPALPAQLLCLSFCKIVFTWLPWCPVPKILFPFFCLLLSCLCWLLCLLPTSRYWSASDLNSGSFSFSYHIVLLGHLTHSSGFYRPCVRQNIDFPPPQLSYELRIYNSSFLCDMFTGIQGPPL